MAGFLETKETKETKRPAETKRDAADRKSAPSAKPLDEENELIAVVFLDEIGLAEESPNRPLKVLHQLLEKPQVGFIGLSNWTLDSAKLNRMIVSLVWGEVLSLLCF